MCAWIPIDVFTSDVCCESQGGGRVTGILLPLYDTAGATSLTFPALGCCMNHTVSAKGRVESSTKMKHHLYFNNDLTCYGLRVGERFCYVVDGSKWYARRKCQFQGGS